METTETMRDRSRIIKLTPVNTLMEAQSEQSTHTRGNHQLWNYAILVAALAESQAEPLAHGATTEAVGTSVPARFAAVYLLLPRNHACVCVSVCAAGGGYISFESVLSHETTGITESNAASNAPPPPPPPPHFCQEFVYTRYEYHIYRAWLSIQFSPA